MKSHLISINSGLVERGLVSNKRCPPPGPLGGSGPGGVERGVHTFGDGKPSSELQARSVYIVAQRNWLEYKLEGQFQGLGPACILSLKYFKAHGTYSNNVS